MNIDEKDKRILLELDRDGRASYASIAKRTRMAKETVRYRVEKLVKDGVIQKFLTVLNTPLIGKSHYQIFLRLQNADDQRRAGLMAFLENERSVAWLAELEGNYDVGFILLVNDQTELQTFMRQIDEKHRSLIMRRSISVNLSGEFYPRDYLGAARKAARPLAYRPAAKTVRLEETDEMICRLLSEDGRRSAVDMSAKLGLSADAVIQRMRRLVSLGVISGHTIVLDHTKTGMLHCKLLLRTGGEAERLRGMLSTMTMNPRVTALIRVLAEWDYEVDIEVSSLDELKDFKMMLTDKYADVLRDYDVLRVVRMPKYTFMP